MTERLIEYLSGFVTERRLKLFDTILDRRTRYMTVVLEDIFQPHNASAVLRSCECFGLQDVHIVENTNPFRVSPDITLGSDKWLTVYQYNKDRDNTTTAINSLKNHGYRIIATSPYAKTCNLEDFDITPGKFALFFGTELKGLSTAALEMADEFVSIPMWGFTESLNISVTAAIFIQHLSGKIRNSENIPWQLTENEKQELKLLWLKKSIQKSDLIIKAFLEQSGSQNKES